MNRIISYKTYENTKTGNIPKCFFQIFQGRAPDDFRNGGSQHHSIASPATSNDLNGNLPNLKPNERAGRCQRYSGSVCQEHLGNKYIYVSQGLTLDYIERQLQKSLMVIKNSPDLSKECAKYAIPAICLSTLPLCDTQIQKPRKVNNNVFFIHIFGFTFI